MNPEKHHAKQREERESTWALCLSVAVEDGEKYNDYDTNHGSPTHKITNICGTMIELDWLGLT